MLVSHSHVSHLTFWFVASLFDAPGRVDVRAIGFVCRSLLAFSFCIIVYSNGMFSPCTRFIYNIFKFYVSCDTI